jgi:glycosyltransferase involved in cell wall biosynthesis
VKILIGSPTSTGIGGIARHVQGLTSFLKSRGHYVEIISSDNTFTIPIKKLKNPSFMLSAFVKSAFKKNFDIVHAQGPPAAFAMKNASGKKVLSLHGIHHNQVKLLHGKSAGYLAEKYEKFALNWADSITVSSQEMVDYYTSKGYKVSLIPNAIDIDELPMGEDRRFDKQIIFAARLSEEKGIHDVIQACEKLSDDIHVVVLGDGPEKNKVEEISKRRKNIHYLGPKNRDETIKLIRGSDILIQPSQMEGGISYTLMESMACHTPIICTNVGGGKDALVHLQNAFLIKPKNSDELLEAILTLMSDQKQRKNLAESGFASIKKYDWATKGNLYLKLYSELINNIR